MYSGTAAASASPCHSVRYCGAQPVSGAAQPLACNACRKSKRRNTVASGSCATKWSQRARPMVARSLTICVQ